MISNQSRLLILVTFLTALTVFSACSLPETNVYESEVTIKNIENPEHVEEFTLIAEDPEKIHPTPELNPDGVENGELKYIFTNLIGGTTIELDINNHAIDSGSYEEPENQNVNSSETDVTFELIFIPEED